MWRDSLCVTYKEVRGSLCVTYKEVCASLCVTYKEVRDSLCVTYKEVRDSLCVEFLFVLRLVSERPQAEHPDWVPVSPIGAHSVGRMMCLVPQTMRWGELQQVVFDKHAKGGRTHDDLPVLVLLNVVGVLAVNSAIAVD